MPEALEAAIRGPGSVVIYQEVVHPLPADHRPVAPFSLRVPGRLTCYLVYPHVRGEQHHIAAFREWLLPQFAESPDASRPHSS